MLQLIFLGLGKDQQVKFSQKNFHNPVIVKTIFKAIIKTE